MQYIASELSNTRISGSKTIQPKDNECKGNNTSVETTIDL